MAQVAIPLALAAAGSAIGAGVGALVGKPKLPPKPPLPNRDAAATAAMDSAEFRRRQGVGATMVTGPNGAEAPSPGAKALLGQ